MSKVIDEEGMLERAPLYLQTYLNERETGAQIDTLRVSKRDAKIIALRGNVIEVDFSDGWDTPKLAIVTSVSRKRILNGWWDAAMMLLLIGSVIGSVIALIYK